MAVSFARIVQDTDTRAGRVFDSIVIGLILFSIVTLSIETLPGSVGRYAHSLGAL